MKKVKGLLLTSPLVLVGFASAIIFVPHKAAIEAKADSIGAGKVFVAGLDITQQTDQKITDGDDGFVQLVDNKLVFNNYDYSGTGRITGSSQSGVWIDAPSDMEFEIIGNNTITMSGNDTAEGSNSGIYVTHNNHNFSFIGEGSLTITVGKSGSGNAVASGIRLEGDSSGQNAMTFDGPNITCNVTNNNNEPSFGLFNTNGYAAVPVVMNSGSLIGNATTSGNTSNKSIGLSLKKLTLNGGRIEGNGNGGTYSSGINASSAEFYLNAGSLYATAQNGGTWSYGLYQNDGEVNVKETITEFRVAGQTKALSVNSVSYCKFSTSAGGFGYSNYEGTSGKTTISPGANKSKVQNFLCINLVRTYQKAKYVTEPSAITGLVYDGESHALVNAGTTDQGTVVYRLGSTGDFGTTIPTEANAGTYEVQCKIEADSEHIDSDVKTINVTIAKAESSYKSKPTAVAGLAYTGSAQELVSGGETNGGTIVYRVGEEGEFDSAIPTATDVGEYKVYYMIEGDSNHNNSEAEFITVSITEAKADPTKGNNGGLSGGAIAGIVVGSVVGVLGLCYLALFFLLNKWIKVGDKAVRVMRFALGSKDGKERYLSFKFKFEYRDKENVFNTKEDALK